MASLAVNMAALVAEKVWPQETSNQMQLDPLSVLFRMAIYSTLSEPDQGRAGPKISFENHAVVLWEYNIKQGVVRAAYSLTKGGTSRHYLHNLKAPIRRAALWYRDETKNDPRMLALFKCAVAGLAKLRKRYAEPHQENNESVVIDACIELLSQVTTPAAHKQAPLPKESEHEVIDSEAVRQERMQPLQDIPLMLPIKEIVKLLWDVEAKERCLQIFEAAIGGKGALNEGVYQWNPHQIASLDAQIKSQESIFHQKIIAQFAS